MRKVRTGTVVRTRKDKTAVVEMVWKQRHRLYQKQVRRVARFYVHDPLNQCLLGDVVRIQEVRPISKTKRWRLMEILERHQVAEVMPIELESDAEVVITAEQTDVEEGAELEAVADLGDEDKADDEEPLADEDEEPDEAPLPDDEDLEEPEEDQELSGDENTDEGELPDNERVDEELTETALADEEAPQAEGATSEDEDEKE